MKRGYLSDYFTGVGVKRLSAVDAEPVKSNQHEIGTTKEMREQFLGWEKQKFQAIYIWLDQEHNPITAEGTATYYDTRHKDPKRDPEYRLYYPSNAVTEIMQQGDALFLALHKSGVLCFIVAPAGSTSEQQLLWLFGLQPQLTFFAPQAAEGKFVSREVENGESELDFAARLILDELGIEFEEPEVDRLDVILERYGFEFPDTKEFSRCARDTLPEIRVADDADAALVAWLDHEEALFRRMERRILSKEIKQGFTSGDNVDVDGFIRVSLSVQNRRKSRMGHSLENHLQAIFKACGIRHARGPVIDTNQRPDFLFPDVETYNHALEGDWRLAVLGAKSTCKDRWRQVLTEAAKIPKKHLLTLEPGISEAQTDQMRAANLQLVVPESIQITYTEAQRGWLPNLGQFIEEVAAKQAA